MPEGEQGQGDGQGQGQGDGKAEGAVTRTEFDGLSGKVDQILDKLTGKPEGDGKPADAEALSVAEQVRKGIDELEAKRKASESAAADKAKADATEARLKALEEKPPGPVETWLTRAQRRIYGQEPDGQATAKRSRQAGQGAAQ